MIAALSVAAGWGAEAPSRLSVEGDGWLELPSELREPEQEPRDGPPRGLASVTPVDAPRINITAPREPARFMVTDSGFPTFPVRVSITSGEGGPIDRRSLKVTAHKGILFKDITADIHEHLMGERCDPSHLCQGLALDVDEFDLSEEGVDSS